MVVLLTVDNEQWRLGYLFTIRRLLAALIVSHWRLQEIEIA